jgi:hypothetical protein
MISQVQEFRRDWSETSLQGGLARGRKLDIQRLAHHAARIGLKGSL